MQRVTSIAEVRAWTGAARAAGERVALVPTMGALHEGHLSLVDAARREAPRVVMSVFVNPLQFGPQEDLARYPRDLAGDAAKAAGRGVDLLFVPDVAEMYPRQPRAVVQPGAMADRWEGAARPGHFAGVLTVVLKLFEIVRPDVAVFGQKDFQQAALVRAMVADLNVPVEIRVEPTVRDADGLALSSRNAYLSADERRRALALPRALAALRERWTAGERDAAALVRAGSAVLDEAGDVRTDYLAVVDPETLEPVAEAVPGSVVLLAARVGSTRLLDNLVLGAS